MIIMKMQGGLGNQMFQYALGRYLSLQNNCDLYLDIDSYKSDPLREFRLNNFALSEYKILSKTQKAIIKMKLKLNILSDYSETQMNFNAEVLSQQNIRLSGYWQTEKYFSKIRETLLTEFIPRHPLQNSLISELAKINSTHSVSVHIRRGDYTTPENKNIHGLINTEWYKQAMQLLNQKIDNPVFFFFSDDIAFTKEHFPEQENYHYINTSPDGFEHEDLFTMSHCKHNIIANSSFSWWAAWLNKNPEKYVIAPQNWFSSPKLDSSDIIPEKWIKI